MSEATGRLPDGPTGRKYSSASHAVREPGTVAREHDVVDERRTRGQVVGLEHLTGRRVDHAGVTRGSSRDEQSAEPVDLQPDRRGAGTLADDLALARAQIGGVDVAVGKRAEIGGPARIDGDALGEEAVRAVRSRLRPHRLPEENPQRERHPPPRRRAALSVRRRPMHVRRCDRTWRHATSGSGTPVRVRRKLPGLASIALRRPPRAQRQVVGAALLVGLDRQHLVQLDPARLEGEP